MLLPRDAQELDPRYVGDAYGLKISRLIFASLVTIDPHTLEPIPDLAERIEATSPTSYRVTLRHGLRFDDGSALDASGVAATFRSVVDPPMASRYAPTFARLARVVALDTHTVSFELDGPHASFITDLELPVLRAEDAHVRIARPGDPAPIGAGPYRLSERADGRLLLEANPHWHGGKPRFPRVRMIVVTDDNTRALRLLAGAADLALNSVPPLLLPLFDKRDDFDLDSARGIGTTYIGVNTEAPLLRDVRVRRAIAHGIDRQLLIDRKLGGRAALATSFVPVGHWAHDPSATSYAYDPALARALLDEAGLSTRGHEPRARLSLRCGNDRFRYSLARAIAAMLREIGLEIDVRIAETASMLTDLDRGQFELTLLQMPELTEPHVLSWFFGRERIPGPGREGANRWRFSNLAFDAALEQGRVATTRSGRVASYREAQRLLATELPVIPLWHEDVVAIRSRRARGFATPRNGRFSTLAR